MEQIRGNLGYEEVYHFKDFSLAHPSSNVPTSELGSPLWITFVATSVGIRVRATQSR